MNPKHKYGYERFTWEDMKLYHEGKFMVELILSTVYEKHYHLKFMWRDDTTPEFFNIFNARENAKRCTLFRINYDMWEPVLGGVTDAFKW